MCCSHLANIATKIDKLGDTFNGNKKNVITPESDTMWYLSSLTLVVSFSKSIAISPKSKFQEWVQADIISIVEVFEVR